MDTDSSCEGSRQVQAEVHMAAFAFTKYSANGMGIILGFLEDAIV